jgi:hypothetical protein
LLTHRQTNIVDKPNGGLAEQTCGRRPYHFKKAELQTVVQDRKLKAQVAPPKWITLSDALEHVLVYRHSPPLAEKALLEALVDAKIAARAAIYHVVPHSSLRQSAQVARDHFISPERWADFVIDWSRSSVSQQESATVAEWGVWETSGKRFPSSWLYKPAIQAVGVVVSEQHVFAIWPEKIERGSAPISTSGVGRPRGTGYQAADTAALAEMDRLYKSRVAKSATDAARRVVLGGAVERLEGSSPESIIARLAKRYRQKGSDSE